MRNEYTCVGAAGVVPTGRTGKQIQSSPTGLHQRVMASVHDVNSILEKDDYHPPPLKQFDDVMDDYPQDGGGKLVGCDDVFFPHSASGGSHRHQQARRRPSEDATATGRGKGHGRGGTSKTAGRASTNKTSGGKKAHPRPGGIYKLLLEEQQPQQYSEDYSDRPYDNAYENSDGVYWAGPTAPVNVSGTSSNDNGGDLAGKKIGSGGQRKSKGKLKLPGGAGSVHEYVSSEHSLQPTIEEKKTDSQKR